MQKSKHRLKRANTQTTHVNKIPDTNMIARPYPIFVYMSHHSKSSHSELQNPLVISVFHPSHGDSRFLHLLKIPLFSIIPVFLILLMIPIFFALLKVPVFLTFLMILVFLALLKISVSSPIFLLLLMILVIPTHLMIPVFLSGFPFS